jgi:hypothetical protein
LLKVPVAQRLDTPQCTNQMAFRRLFADCKERVRCTTECGNNHCGLTGKASLHDRGGSIDCFRVTD